MVINMDHGSRSSAFVVRYAASAYQRMVDLHGEMWLEKDVLEQKS